MKFLATFVTVSSLAAAAFAAAIPEAESNPAVIEKRAGNGAWCGKKVESDGSSYWEINTWG
jgi:hypothetical protein